LGGGRRDGDDCPSATIGINDEDDEDDEDDIGDDDEEETEEAPNAAAATPAAPAKDGDARERGGDCAERRAFEVPSNATVDDDDDDTTTTTTMTAMQQPRWNSAELLEARPEEAKKAMQDGHRHHRVRAMQHGKRGAGQPLDWTTRKGRTAASLGMTTPGLLRPPSPQPSPLEFERLSPCCTTRLSACLPPTTRVVLAESSA